MAVISLKGGLGNQMFQYAAARGLGKSGCVYLDTAHFERNNKSSDAFTAREIEIFLFPEIKAKKLNRFLQKSLAGKKLFRRLARRLAPVRFVSQKENEFFPELLSEWRMLFMDGYFQSEKYFKHIRKDLVTEFTFPTIDDSFTKEIASRIEGCSQAVSLHVRRGDYLKPVVQNYHGLLPVDYYRAASSEVEAQVTKPTYFVFSDDPKWCRSNLGFLNGDVVFVDGNTAAKDAWKDMYLMTLCKHHIIANSSFSWWGAWLSHHYNGLKVAPRMWFNHEIANFNIHDFIPATWKIIAYGESISDNAGVQRSKIHC